MQWGSPSTPSYLSPVTMAMLGMNTSGAGGGQYNTQSQQWENPTGVNAGITGGRVGAPGQTNYSGMPNPGNGMSASGFAGSPGLGNGGFGPMGPTPPPAGGVGQYDPVLNPTGYRPGTGTPGMDAGGSGQGVSNPEFGTGGLGGLSRMDPGMMQALFQHMQNMSRGGQGQVDPATTPTRNYTTKPFQVPNNMAYGAGYTSQPASTGYDFANRGGDTYGDGGSTGGLTSLSQQLGNRPGQSSMFKIWNR